MPNFADMRIELTDGFRTIKLSDRQIATLPKENGLIDGRWRPVVKVVPEEVVQALKAPKIKRARKSKWKNSR